MIDTLKKIEGLLKKYDEKQWSISFHVFINSYSTSENRDLKNKIRGIYRGMGSFNDLILFKDGRMCTEGNIKLDALRKKLFREVTQ